MSSGCRIISRFPTILGPKLHIEEGVATPLIDAVQVTIAVLHPAVADHLPARGLPREKATVMRVLERLPTAIGVRSGW